MELAEADPNREDWDLPAAYEGMARALGVAGDVSGAAEWKARASEAVESIVNPEDRTLIAQDIASLP